MMVAVISSPKVIPILFCVLFLLKYLPLLNSLALLESPWGMKYHLINVLSDLILIVVTRELYLIQGPSLSWFNFSVTLWIIFSISLPFCFCHNFLGKYIHTQHFHLNFSFLFAHVQTTESCYKNTKPDNLIDSY